MKMVSGVGEIAHLEKFRRHGIVYAFCGWHIFSHDMKSGRASEAKALCKECQKISEKAFNDSYAAEKEIRYGKAEFDAFEQWVLEWRKNNPDEEKDILELVELYWH